jgi:hypothetical protein
MKKITFLLTSCILLHFAAKAQSFYDMSTIQTIEITFAQSNWDQLLDAEKAGAENYIMATTVKINNTTFDSVGVKYKGNSTYKANQVKNPFHIELDTYKEQDYQGYTDIKLSNVAKDPSFLREVLSYQILRQYMHAPQSNYANVYVNGVLIGLYSNSEAINKGFVNRKFYSKKGTFLKCNPTFGAGPQSTDFPNLEFLGTDSTDYYDSYELKSDNGWQELINLCDTLENATASIENILDVDRAIWMLAFDNALVNLDSYIGGFKQNYYLYRDNNGRFNSIVWDLNQSFGSFGLTNVGNLNSNTQKQQLTHLLGINDTELPLVKELFAIPMYRRMYLAHIKTMLTENFSNGSYATTGQTLQNTISTAVQNDPNKFFTFANFQSNLNNDVGGGPGPGGGSYIGITNLMGPRATYLLGLNDFTATEPSISNVAVSNTSPALNATVTITANVANETAVYLGSRTGVEDQFVRVPMFDDGLHNDGAANDGVYGVDVTMSNIFVQYYIYADGSTIGKFSPVRAEHEYHTISIATPPVTDIVINEILASNSTVQGDDVGEFNDWIELHNNTNSAVNIGGYYLSDKIDNLTKWEIPAGTNLPAQGYQIIWADEDSSQGVFHANFKLASAGETLFLVNPSGTIVDQLIFPTQTTDISYGRFVNGTGPFQTMQPTFNGQNTNTTNVNTTAKEKTVLSVSPNPARDVIKLSILSANTKLKNVSVYDLNGRVIHHNTILKELEINTSEWASALYLIKIDDASVKVIVE